MYTHIHICTVAPDARRDLADAIILIDRKRIPLTPSYSARNGSGCLGKESSRLRGNEESERRSFARSIAAQCKNVDLEIL